MGNLGGTEHEIGFGVTEGAPEVYYAVGKTNSSGNGGQTWSFGARLIDIYAVGTDHDGDLAWEEHYGPAVDNELTYGASPTSDGGFIVTGKMDYYWELYDDMFMLKLGPSSSGIPSPAYGKLSFYSTPNPFHGITSFSFRFSSPAYARLIIYDLLGHVRAVIDLGQVPAGRMTREWDASALAPGIYLSRLEAGGEVVVKKLVVRE